MNQSTAVSRDAVLDALLAMLPVMPMARPASPHGRTVAEMATEHMLLLRQERDQLVDALRAVDSAHALAAADAASLRRQIDEARLVAAAQTGPTDAARGLVWTAARRDLLRERFPQSRDDEALRQELNWLPGLLPVATVQALRSHAAKLGLRRDASIVHEMRAAGAADANARRLTLGGGRKPTWTAERDALLQKEYAAVASINALLVRLNALPGVAITGPKAIRERAKKLRLRLPEQVTMQRKRAGAARGNVQSRVKAQQQQAATRTQPLSAQQPRVVPQPAPVPNPEPAQPPTAEASAAIADAALSSKHERVRASIRKAMKRSHGSLSFESAIAISTQHSLPVREVMRLAGEVRNQEGT